MFFERSVWPWNIWTCVDTSMMNPWYPMVLKLGRWTSPQRSNVNKAYSTVLWAGAGSKKLLQSSWIAPNFSEDKARPPGGFSQEQLPLGLRCWCSTWAVNLISCNVEAKKPGFSTSSAHAVGEEGECHCSQPGFEVFWHLRSVGNGLRQIWCVVGSPW